MNDIKAKAFLLILCIFLPQRVFGQNNSSRIDNSNPFSLNLEVGYSFTLIGGTARKGLKDVIEGFEGANNDSRDSKGRIKTKLSPVLGVNMRYEFQKNIYFNGGIRFVQRGYNLKITGEDKDLEYQFDQEFSYREKFRVATFEIPLSVSYSLENKIIINAGLILGFASGNSSKLKVITRQDIIINGELSDDLSTSDDFTLNLPDITKSPYWGFSISADYELLPDVSVSLSLLRTGRYAVLDYGKVADNSVMLSVKYLLHHFQ